MWDRKLWGVEFSGPDIPPYLIDASWDENYPLHQMYFGEPSRALLFTKLMYALDWCRKQMAEYAGRTDDCAKWRFRPVQVRERVTIVEKEA